MRILYVVGDSYQNGSGIYSIINPLIDRMNSKDFEANVLMVGSKGEDFINNRIYLYNKNFFDKDFSNYSLVIFNGIYYLMFIKIAKLLFSKEIPYCFKPHSSLMKTSFRKSFLKKIIFLLLFKSIFNKAKAIIYTNEEEKENSLKWLNKNQLLEMNGIESFLPPGEKSCDNLVNLFFLARIDFSHKGVDLLLKALFLLKDFFEQENCFFTFYGRGHPAAEKRFLNTLKRLNSDRVMFKGSIFDDKKNDMYKQQNICVLTSRYEGFPTSLTEALFFGIPLVVTKGTNGKNVCDAGAGWFIEKNSPKYIAEMIKKAILAYKENPTKYQENAYKYAFENCNIEKTINIAIQNINMMVRDKNE